MKECRRCGDKIDRSACGQAYTTFTIHDDRGNNPAKKKRQRGYLCGLCTFHLERLLKNLVHRIGEVPTQ